MGDGHRKRTRAFTELQSHYLFDDRFGRPGKGNDKGKVEGLVGYMRRNFLVPVPSFESFEALNAYLNQYQGGMCIRGLDDDRKDSTATHITLRPQLGGHRQCGLAICTFHLGFSLEPLA